MRTVNAVPAPFLRPRSILRSAILPVALACLTASAFAGTNGWTVTGPPFEVQSMAVDPHDNRILFAAGFDTMARSADRGATWTVMPVPGIAQPSAIRVAFSLPSTVYVLGVLDLYRSVSGGTSWVKRTVPIPGFPQDLQVDARDSQVLVLTAQNLCFFGCSGGGVYRSTNGGGSWSSIGFKNSNVSRLALDPTSSSIIYISNGPVLLRTGNGGNSWTDISPPDSGEVWGIAVDPVVPSNVYVATEGGVFRTPDSGHSWELLRPSQYSTFIAIEPGNSRWVFASVDGAFLSTDSGKSWLQLSDRGPQGGYFSSRGQFVVTRDAIYSIANIPGASGQILVYDLKQVHRRAAPGR